MITVTAAGPALAAAAPGFGHAISGAGPVFLAFLAVHVPAGLTAVISGVLAATAPKRRGRHTRAGTVYYWAITAVFATAAAMTAMRPARDWYLALLGALAFLLAAAGRHARRHPRSWPWRDHPPGHTPHITAMGGSYTVLLTAFYVDNGKNLPLWDRLPAAAGLSTDEAACVPVAFGTAHDALFEFGRLQPGETLLVHAGAGGVGIAAIQLAKRAGARVLATPSSDDKLARLAWFGLDHGINYRAADFAAQTRRLTGGHGADVILDGVGGSPAT